MKTFKDIKVGDSVWLVYQNPDQNYLIEAEWFAKEVEVVQIVPIVDYPMNNCLFIRTNEIRATDAGLNRDTILYHEDYCDPEKDYTKHQYLHLTKESAEECIKQIYERRLGILERDRRAIEFRYNRQICAIKRYMRNLGLESEETRKEDEKGVLI
jgi:hypothetical protein